LLITVYIQAVRRSVTVTADDWNLDDVSGRWSIQSFLEPLQFTYGVDALFTISIVADELTPDRNLMQVRLSSII